MAKRSKRKSRHLKHRPPTDMSGFLISTNRAGLIAAGATDAEANHILLSVPDPTNPDMVLDAYRKFLNRRPLLKLWRTAKRRFGRRRAE